MKEGNPTAKGEIDIIEIDVDTNSIIRQIELADIIQGSLQHWTYYNKIIKNLTTSFKN